MCVLSVTWRCSAREASAYIAPVFFPGYKSVSNKPGARQAAQKKTLLAAPTQPAPGVSSLQLLVQFLDIGGICGSQGQSSQAEECQGELHRCHCTACALCLFNVAVECVKYTQGMEALLHRKQAKIWLVLVCSVQPYLNPRFSTPPPLGWEEKARWTMDDASMHAG